MVKIGQICLFKELATFSFYFFYPYLSFFYLIAKKLLKLWDERKISSWNDFEEVFLPLKLLISGLCSAANRDVGYCPCVICICGTSQQSCLEIVMTGMLACLSASGLEKSVCQYAMLCQPPRQLFAFWGSQVLAGTWLFPLWGRSVCRPDSPSLSKGLKLPAEFVQTWQHILCHPHCCHFLFWQLPLQVSLAGPNSSLYLRLL